MFSKKDKGPLGSEASSPAKRRKVNIERRFTIISQFAQGSMSTVYRALDNETGRTICLKVQHTEKTNAAKARAVKVGRLSEGEIAMRIVHPNVVRTFEFGETTKNDYYIVMEFIDGVSVQYLRESKTLQQDHKLDLIIQAAEGLAAVHATGFIHHDFGPKNLLVGREHNLKLIDFGLAVPNTPDFRKPGNRTGTLNYMAPELLRREPTDERIDIFSFGVMAFELYTDRLPYDATNQMAVMLTRINSDPMDPARANPKLSRELCAFLKKVTARHRKDRYSSMTEVIQALKALPASET
ncbi:MAG TPA: serine/threonine-protein kinase [Isosphaeraceae bacterium]|jgi:serine/threonine protein kinase|nr:serine/threonine-protein kinase [Isosphaeraceae bacterium]